jgi:hypothetical protein
MTALKRHRTTTGDEALISHQNSEVKKISFILLALVTVPRRGGFETLPYACKRPMEVGSGQALQAGIRRIADEKRFCKIETDGTDKNRDHFD